MTDSLGALRLYLLEALPLVIGSSFLHSYSICIACNHKKVKRSISAAFHISDATSYLRAIFTFHFFSI